MNFSILTFGCKVNQCESEDICQIMIDKGYKLSDNIEFSDIIIFNSCTVTAESNRKVRQAIHRIKRKNPNCITVLTGCMSQVLSSDSSEINDVDIAIGNSNKVDITLYIEKFINKRQKVININPYNGDERFNNVLLRRFPKRTRAFVRIEDGCERFCSYCIIPYARGRVRSRELSDIREEAQTLSDNGYKELVLVGINLSSYGLDIGKDLCDAVELVCKINGIDRVRLGSLEPDMVNKDMIKRLSKLKGFCPQFHLSLQSGSDKILKAMGRLYTKSEYIYVVKMIREHFPNSSITTDIMTGFPGESVDDFNQTISMIKEIGFLRIHVFPYSVRPGTAAASFPNQISGNVKSMRAKTAIMEHKNQLSVILAQNIGKKVSVLYESVCGDDIYEGYTPDYMLVRSSSKEDIRGLILDTTIASACHGYCCGIINM